VQCSLVGASAIANHSSFLIQKNASLGKALKKGRVLPFCLVHFAIMNNLNSGTLITAEGDPDAQVRLANDLKIEVKIGDENMAMKNSPFFEKTAKIRQFFNVSNQLRKYFTW
jgi:hypothetical protein